MFRDEDPQQALPKGLTLVPPACLFASSFVLVGAAILAWGAGEAVELPPWMTTLAGVIVAIPAAAIGAIGFSQVRKRTRGDFFVSNPVTLSVGAAWLLVAAATELLVALHIGDPATYDPLRDEEGNPEMVPLAFLYVTLVGTYVLAFLMAPGAYLYSQMLTPGRPKRFAKRPDERDLMAEYFRGRGRFDRFDRHRFDRSER